MRFTKKKKRSCNQNPAYIEEKGRNKIIATNKTKISQLNAVCDKMKLYRKGRTVLFPKKTLKISQMTFGGRAPSWIHLRISLPSTFRKYGTHVNSLFKAADEIASLYAGNSILYFHSLGQSNRMK